MPIWSRSVTGAGPIANPRAGESHQEAVAREITTVRSGLGLLDASTLGKIHLPL